MMGQAEGLRSSELQLRCWFSQVLLLHCDFSRDGLHELVSG